MPELMVVGFEGTHRATEVLRDLRDLQTERAIDVSDAVAVYRTDEGRLLVDESVKPTSVEGATLGGLLGVMGRTRAPGVSAVSFLSGIHDAPMHNA